MRKCLCRKLNLSAPVFLVTGMKDVPRTKNGGSIKMIKPIQINIKREPVDNPLHTRSIDIHEETLHKYRDLCRKADYLDLEEFLSDILELAVDLIDVCGEKETPA